MISKFRSIIRLAWVLPVCGSLLASCARLSGPINPGSTSPPKEVPSSPVSSGEQPAGVTPVSPLDPIPGEATMKRGEVNIEKSEVVLLGSHPPTALSLKGTLPTPCYHLRAKISRPDTENRIQVEVYSLYDPTEICIQMLQAFDTSIPLGTYPDGNYTVWVNGSKIGEFTIIQ